MYSILKFFALFVVLINYSFSQTLPSFIELVKDNGNKVVNISASKSVDNSGPNIPKMIPFMISLEDLAHHKDQRV